MSDIAGERDAYLGWTGCVHCGQTLPHVGTGWRESSRCRLFQRIAEQAWDEGYSHLFDSECTDVDPVSLRDNPYRAGDGASGGGQS